MDSETAWRGGQQSLLTLARELRVLGHEQSIVAPGTSALAERARAEGFPVEPTISRDVDIVHAHSGRALNRVFRATVGSSVIRVMTRHVAFTPKHPWIHRFKYTHSCHGIIAVSNAVREALLRAGIASEKIEIVHTGIDLPQGPRERSRGPFTVGHLGAFTREKGQDVVIAVARLLPEVRFILAGEGALRDELQSAAPPNVEFPGFVNNLSDFFSRIDLFAMPSRSEAWGLAALEAMAYGVPVIASDIQGLAEIVEAGRGGWLVPVGDAEALAHSIRDAASDPDRLAAFGLAARERAGQFTVERMARQTEAFYRRLLS